MPEDRRGMALIILISFMILCALAAVTAFSLLGQGTIGGVGYTQSIEALGIAIGGKEWYLQQLADDSDWTDETDQSGIALGSGTFDVTVDSATAVAVSFTITGKVAGFSGQNAQKQISQTAYKFPSAARFAVFWQLDGPGTRLNFQTGSGGTQITGDYWSVGSSRINAPCAVTGTLYYGSGETIDGSGTYTTEEIDPPFSDMPQVDTTTLDSLMATYDAAIAANSSSSTAWQSGVINLSGGTLNFRDFRTRNNLIITGYGRICANRDVKLHSSGGSSSSLQTLTIAPSGGTGIIEIMAGRNFVISATGGNRVVTISRGVRMYAQSPASNRYFDISESNATSIDNALIMARQRLTVGDGASVTNSILYLDYSSSSSNNYLQIANSGTAVTGAVISEGRYNTALDIRSGASVTGLLYQYASATEGLTRVDGGSAITGSLMLRQFYNNSLGPATITYSSAAILSALPGGFPGGVMTDIESWNDE